MNAVQSKYFQTLQYIQEEGPIDQSQIAHALHVSLMTVNKIVNKLSMNNIVVKSGTLSGKSGRKSDLFTLNPNLFISTGMHINEDRIIVSAVKPDGSVISKKEYLLDIESEKLSSADAFITIIRKYLEIFIKEFSLDMKKIAVIGIAPGGIIDTANGRCILGTHSGGLRDVNLGERLHDIFHLPIFVDDPARAVTYYEKKYGDGAGVGNFIYVYLGKGVGGGIVVDGKIYRGFRGIAGEIGHIIVDKSGSRCKCGNYGCLETIASEESIIRQIKEGIEEGVFTRIADFCGGDINCIDLLVLKEAADNNDKFSHNILEHVGNYLGKALALLVNIFNPELILIGGSVAILGKFLLDSVNRVIKNEALNVMNERTLIQVSNYNSFKDSIGTAVEAFDMLFDPTTEDGRQFIDNLLGRVHI